METIEGKRPTDISEIVSAQPQTPKGIEWSLADQRARLIEGVITPPRFWGEESLSERVLLYKRLGGSHPEGVVTKKQSEPETELEARTPLEVPAEYHPKAR